MRTQVDAPVDGGVAALALPRHRGADLMIRRLVHHEAELRERGHGCVA